MSIGQNIEFGSFGTTQYHPLGYRVQVGGKTYRYAYNAGADTLAAGEVVGWYKTTPVYGHITGTVATFMDNGTAGLGVGVALSAAPAANFCWIQTQGVGEQALTTDGGVAQGDGLVVNGGTSPDGTVDTMADGEEELVFGWALAADSSTTQTAGSYTLNSERHW